MNRAHIRPAPRLDLEASFGRALAIAVHPFAAWRARPSARVPLVTGYFVAGYALVLGVLQLL